MTAYIHSADRSSYKVVKNLGWLLRNWKLVDRFVVQNSSQLFPHDILLQAFLNDDRVYQTSFGSREVLWHWLSRPVFKGALLEWFGEKTVCGSPSFNWEK